MTKGLHLARGLYLPEEAVTRSFAILGMRGSGKSNAAVVLAEQMWKAGIPWLAIDPKGDWWGMKSSQDGEGPGLPVVIFGGEHQDVALQPTAAAGVEVAEAILGEGLTCILDLSEFTKGQKIELLAGVGNREGFAERLVRRKKRDQEPLHVFLEEAHDYVPQKAHGDVGKMVEVVGRIQTMGRQKGMGCSVLSQRSARVHKDVLSQCDTLIALRTISPHDRKAILEWVEGHGLAKDLVNSLPGLDDGEAWVWSPEWLHDLLPPDGIARVRFNRRETYDSAATPVRGAGSRRSVTLADVDLKALEERMAAAIERAKQEDPKELQKELARLRKELASRPTETKTKVEEVVKEVQVEVPVFKDGEVSRLEKVVGQLSDVGAQLVAVAQDVGEALRGVTRAPAARPQRSTLTAPVRARSSMKGQVRTSHSSTSSEERKREVTEGEFHPTRAMRRILDALAWLEQVGLRDAKREAVAFLAGQRPTSGGFKNNLGAMRSAGLIEYPVGGCVALTPSGQKMAEAPAEALTPEELQAQVYERVTGSQRALLEVLVAEYPVALPREDLADRLNVPQTSGGFKNNLGALRTLGLIDYPSPGWVAAEPVLFLEE